MNIIYKHIISYVVLLSFIATLVPLNIFHEHIETVHCDQGNSILERNPCHVSIYHQQSKEEHCKHNAHITSEYDACDFCKVITPRRLQYTIIQGYLAEFHPKIDFQNSLVRETSLKLLILPDTTRGRAPPTC